MSYPNQKPKNLGSAYFNVKKAASDEDREIVAQCVETMKDLGAYLAISIRKKDSDEYVKLTGFFNTFKQSEKNPDIIIRPSMVAGSTASAAAKPKFGAKKSFGKAAPKPAPRPAVVEEDADEMDDDDSPFA
jgi:hypothetical protein